ncbi:MAG: threonine/serine exporter family protein [Ruminococcaceae bacterium]|nr:threonine/serine exporter family protein [Oscillospiraceae bacterium]
MTEVKNEEISKGSYTADFILAKALDIGENILRCGGEPYRIEDTVTRICVAYGAEFADIFALPSLIIANIRMKDGTYSSQVRRVYQTSNNMYLLEKMNNLSRDICFKKVSLEDVPTEIENAKKGRPFPDLLCYIGGILGAGGFAVFFGGNIYDALVAAVAGIVVTFFNLHKTAFVNQMIHSVISSFVGAIVSLALISFGVGQNTDMILIGVIMLLIPGLAFGNAVRDLLFGDTVSGIIQLVQAILIAVMVAFGFTVAMMIFGGVFS